MGAAASTISNALDASKEDQAKQKEQLELTMKLANARLDTFEAELKDISLDRESAMKKSVPGKRALRFERHVQVDTETSPGEGIDQAVDGFVGSSETGSKGALDGFKNVVKVGLSDILENTSAGESYGKKFFVCVKHNAIIRVDIYTYKYNFTNKEGIANIKNILAYVMCISAIDHHDITTDELIYLASESAGDASVGSDGGFEQYLEMLLKTWNALKAADPLPMHGRPPMEDPRFLTNPRTAA